MSPMRLTLSCLLLAGLLPACASEEAIEITFDPRVAGEPFRCGTTYSGMGSAGVEISGLDFRFYVHDVTLVTEDGEEVALSLTQDNIWQRDTIALLDFEDGTGDCQTGSTQTRYVVTGTAPRGDYHGLSFTLGIPADMNHLDAATAPAPLNVPGLWWSWTGGYKFMRLDVATPNNPAFYFHLGQTDCSGTQEEGYACAWDNYARVSLDEFHPGEGVVEMDLARFYQGSDLESIPDYVSDYVSGCMAFSGDPECEPLFNTLGMSFEGTNDAPPTQQLFAVK